MNNRACCVLLATVLGCWGVACGADEKVGKSTAALSAATWVASPPGYVVPDLVPVTDKDSIAVTAANAHGFGVAWVTYFGPAFTFVRPGGVVQPIPAMKPTGYKDGRGDAGIASDGESFLIVSGGNVPTAWRVTEQGKFGPELPLGTALAGRPALIADGKDYLMVWDDGTRLLGARLAPQESSIAPIVLFDDGKRRKEPRLAYGGGNWLLVWEEAGGIGRTRLSSTLSKLDAFAAPLGMVSEGGPDPNDIQQYGGPLLASDGNTFLLASARSVVELDAAAVPRGSVQAGLGTAGSLVFDGEGYYAAWTTSALPASVYGQKVSLRGTPDPESLQTLVQRQRTGPSVARLATGERLVTHDRDGIELTAGSEPKQFPIGLRFDYQSSGRLTAGKDRALALWRSADSLRGELAAFISLTDPIPATTPVDLLGLSQAIGVGAHGSDFLLAAGWTAMSNSGRYLREDTVNVVSPLPGGRLDTNGAGFQLTSLKYSVNGLVIGIDVNHGDAGGFWDTPKVLCSGNQCWLWDVCPEGSSYAVLWAKGSVNRIDRYSEKSIKLGGGEVELPLDLSKSETPTLLVNPLGHVVVWSGGIRFFDSTWATTTTLPGLGGRLLTHRRNVDGETLFYINESGAAYRAELRDAGTLSEPERLPALDGSARAVTAGAERLLAMRREIVEGTGRYGYRFIQPGLEPGQTCDADWLCSSSRCEAGFCGAPLSGIGGETAGGEAAGGEAAGGEAAGGVPSRGGVGPGGREGTAGGTPGVSGAGSSSGGTQNGQGPETAGAPSGGVGGGDEPGRGGVQAGAPHSGAPTTSVGGSGGLADISSDGGCCSIAGGGSQRPAWPALASGGLAVLLLVHRRAKSRRVRRLAASGRQQ